MIENTSMNNIDSYHEVDMISSLNAELLKIKAVHEMTRKKTRDLMDKISTYELRHEQVSRAWMEAEKIALGISDMAQTRVDKIVDKAHRTVGPLHEEITAIDKEISFLAQELEPPAAQAEEQVEELKTEIEMVAPQETEDLAMEMDATRSSAGVSDLETQNVEPAEATEVDSGDDTASYADMPLPKREYSLREPQDESLGEPFIPAQGVEIQEYLDLPLPRRGYSLREPDNELDQIQQELIVEEAFDTDIHAILLEKREYSLREPGEAEIEIDEIVTEKAEADLSYAQQEHHGYSMGVAEVYEKELQELDLEVLGADETEMRFDVFIDSRHFEIIDGIKTPIHRHNWQVKVDVETVGKNPDAPGYAKISSIVDCTLLRYDGVLLNEAYPFTLIDPSCINMAMYFFNFLDDNLVLLGMAVKGVTLWENPDDAITVNTRNIEIDALLKRGEEDIFGGLRDKINNNNSSIINVNTSLKERLGSIFKGR